MRNSLNEALKARSSKKTPASGEMTLDDVSRVKVLSPGRQVFKRFVRNRLAVTGSCILIVMFLFSFFGPLFYPYGQKQIFYKYDTQKVNYALAKHNTAYNGYDVDASVALPRTVVNAMNSNIKSMAAGEELRALFEGGEAFLIRKFDNEVYTLSACDTTPVCTSGKTNVKVGVYSMLKKAVTYEAGGKEIPGLAEAAAKSCKGKSGSFEVGGVTYTFTMAVAKQFDIFTESDGIVYTGEAPAEGFESALEAASASTFVFDGTTYLVEKSGAMSTVYSLDAEHTGKVYTLLTLDMYETGVTAAKDFRPAALMASCGDGSFEAGGAQYTVQPDDASLLVLDAEGKEYAEFSDFSVRRYTGEDTMDFSLKMAVADEISDMLANGKKQSTFRYELPMQSETGSYVYDDDGQLQYAESELTVSQKDTGEFVITCEQVIYVIDMYESPSVKHILGTDGDGFDVLARIMYGGRISLMVGFVVVFLETFLGVVMGGLAGYYGGWVDNLIMRLVDVFYCLPSTPIMIILGAMMDAMRMNTYVRLMIMMAALGLLGWAGVARLVRGQILSLREQEFMVATEATGIRVKQRIFRHLVPNVMPQLIVTATMGMGSVIITESTLSFLGLGVKHPLATWGTIINSVSSASAMAHYAFIWIPVGLLICLTVIAFNFVGDGLRDAYDPKSKR